MQTIIAKTVQVRRNVLFLGSRLMKASNIKKAFSKSKAVSISLSPRLASPFSRQRQLTFCAGITSVELHLSFRPIFALARTVVNWSESSRDQHNNVLIFSVFDQRLPKKTPFWTWKVLFTLIQTLTSALLDFSERDAEVGLCLQHGSRDRRQSTISCHKKNDSLIRT